MHRQVRTVECHPRCPLVGHGAHTVVAHQPGHQPGRRMLAVSVRHGYGRRPLRAATRYARAADPRARRIG